VPPDSPSPAIAVHVPRMVRLTDIQKSADNPREMSDEERAGLRASLEQFGLVENIVVNRRTGLILGGHQRYDELVAAGVDEAPVIEVDLPPARAKALNIALNSDKIAGRFTPAVIGLLDEIRVELPAEFSALRLDALAEDLRVDFADALPPDPVPVGEDPGPLEPSVNPVSERGQIYQLGPHRVMCGDSTSAADMARLLGGEVASLLSTDPPYCVDYTGKDRPVHDGRPSGKDWSHVYREVDIKDLGEFLDKVFAATLPHVVENAAVYVWHAHLQQPTIAATFEKHALLLHQIVIWVKPVATFGHSYYRWKHEPCAFGWRRGHKPQHGYGQLESVWEIDWEGKARIVGNEHPTQKPVEIFARPMRVHTKPGDLCLEPFGGSGSQIIAAATEGRRCYSMEISPAFVDAIRRRWTRYAKSAGIDPGPGALEDDDPAV
jgi:DNA modification methylase